MNEPITYKCSACGHSVQVKDGKFSREDCDHNDAAVTADMSATAYGEASLKPTNKGKWDSTTLER